MATFPRGHNARTTIKRDITRKVPIAKTEQFEPHNITVTQLLNRDGPLCYLCHHPLAADHQIDHILPRSHGGGDHPNNLALACGSCNARKNDRFVSIRISDRIPCYWIGT